MADLTKPEIIEAARRYLDRELAAHEEALKSAAQDDEFGTEFQADAWGQEQRSLQRNIADYRFDPITKRTAAALLKANGHTVPAEGTEAFDAACHYALRAEAELARIMIAKFSGNFADAAIRDPDLASAALMPMMQPAVPDSESLGKLVDQYVALKSVSHWVYSTRLDNIRAFDWLKESLGADTPIATITTKDIRAFRDLLAAMPKHWGWKKKFKGLPLAKVVEKAGKAPRIAPRTADRYMGWVRALLDWAVVEGHVPMSPAKGIKVMHKSHSVDSRLPYSTDQLTTLFNSPMYVGCQSALRRYLPGPAVVIDAKWWLPLLCLFTGARPGELVQLGVNDIVEFKGVWVVDIHPDGEGKKLKTKASTRRIPIHKQLIKLGFVEYAKDRQATAKSGRLFEDVAVGSINRAGPFGKWYSRYSDKIGIKTPKTQLYSMRHSFADACRAHSVPYDVLQALLGHAMVSITSTYGSALPIHILNQNLQKLSFGVTFGHLRKYKPKTAP